MGSLNGFLEHMDWFQLFLLLIGAVACLFCITFHELAHGFAAYQLGDPTAKVNGRLTLNPISHIDWIGLMLLLTVRVGWAKPGGGLPDLSLRASGNGGGLCHLFLPVYGGAQCRAGDL